MIIETDCPVKKTHIENLEINDSSISFFLNYFFYLNFETPDEKEKFISELINATERKYNFGESYVELDDSFLAEEEKIRNNATYLHMKSAKIESYSFNCGDDYLSMEFNASNKKKITFFIFQQLTKKINEKLK